MLFTSGCILSNLAVVTLAEALKRQTSTVVTVIGTFEIIMSYVVQIFIMGEDTDVYSVVGATVVLCGIIAVTLESGQPTHYSVPGDIGDNQIGAPADNKESKGDSDGKEEAV